MGNDVGRGLSAALVSKTHVLCGVGNSRDLHGGTGKDCRWRSAYSVHAVVFFLVFFDTAPCIPLCAQRKMKIVKGAPGVPRSIV
jgi:hypothetical protein